MVNNKISAGLLMYRRKNKQLEVFLVHPGGPFFKFKDKGSWSIPKGLRHDNEDFFETAKREFTEETGIGLPDNTAYYELGSTTYPNGKVVHCWAFENDLSDNFVLKSNKIPLIGGRQGWAEVDKGEFFDTSTATVKILPAQKPFIDRLRRVLSGE